MKKNLLKKGFTLVEVITVLFVMSMGLIGVLGLILQNIQSQSYNKGNLIAYQLAQEGIELVRKVRDNNWRNSLPYDTSLTAGEYYMDYRDNLPTIYSSGHPEELILSQDANNFYIHGAGATTTPFSRLIKIEPLTDHSMRVTADVTWGDHNRNYSYNLETILYNWR